jgi:Domain of unknown function (DUF5658)
MFRTLPRLTALALTVFSLTHLAATPADAQELLASSVITASALPGPLTGAVLFPVAPVESSIAEAPAPATASPDFSRIRRPSLLPALYAANVALQAMDAHSTLTAIGNGAREANPVMKGVVGNRGALLAVKAGAAAGTIYIAERLWRRNRVGAIVLMAVVNGVTAAVVAHNYKVASRLR